jgi:hypothetical protein
LKLGLIGIKNHQKLILSLAIDVFSRWLPGKNKYGGYVSNQPKNTHDDRQNSLTDGAPKLRFGWHPHA